MLGHADAVLSDPMATTPLISPDRLMQANLGKMTGLPAGVRGYSIVSTISGNGVCSRSVEISSRGDGAKPTVLTHTSGDCAGAQAPPAAHMPERPMIAGPRLMETTWEPAPSARPRLQPVNARVD
jgi:hypothetical protein